MRAISPWSSRRDCGSRPGRRLVEEHELGPVDERERQRQPLTLTAGERIERRVGLVGERETFEQLRRRLGRAIERAEQRSASRGVILSCSAVVCSAAPIFCFTSSGLPSRVDAADLDRTLIRLAQPDDALDGRRLAGAVRPEEAEDLAVGHVEADAAAAATAPYRLLRFWTRLGHGSDVRRLKAQGSGLRARASRSGRSYLSPEPLSREPLESSSLLQHPAVARQLRAPRSPRRATPAVSPFGMTWIGMSGLLGALRRHAGADFAGRSSPGTRLAVSIAPPPTISASGSNVLIISSKNRPEGVRLDAEDLAAHRVAALRHAADALGRLRRGRAPSAARGPGSCVRKCGSSVRPIAVSEQSDSRSPVRPQLQSRRDARDRRDALIGNQHVAELAAESLATFHDVAVDDDAAAEAGADDGGDRSRRTADAEDGEVPPQRAGVAVVEVGDRLAELGGEPVADVEAGPVGMDEVGRARARSGRRRCWRDRACRDRRQTTLTGPMPAAAAAISRPSAICCRQIVRPFLRPRRVLAQAVDQPRFLPRLAVDETCS